MPTFKLTYFEARGRAETLRMLFAVGNVDYEDHRIKFEEWAELKPSTPYGVLPMLEVDGRKLGESCAIMRYLARKLDLAGNCPVLSAAIDSCCCVSTDLREKMIEMAQKKEPEKEKAKSMGSFKEGTLAGLLDKLENNLKKNKDGDKFCYTDEITVADIHFFAVADELMVKVPDALDGHPKLKALHERVRNHPAIDKWLEDRPKTDL